MRHVAGNPAADDAAEHLSPPLIAQRSPPSGSGRANTRRSARTFGRLRRGWFRARTVILLHSIRQGLPMLPAVHPALRVRPDLTDPALDRVMSVRLMSISGSLC
jgi:hypothetical protein